LGSTLNTFTWFEKNIWYLYFWAPLKIIILNGVQLGYFETRFEKNIFYLQPGAAVKINVFVLVGLNLGYIMFWQGLKKHIQFSTLGSSKNCNC